MDNVAFTNGCNALRAHDYKGAVRDFETVLNHLDEHDTEYNRVQSYLGLSQVLTNNRNGLLLCRDAASVEAGKVEVFHNLACAEWFSGNRKRAIDSLRLGLKIDAGNSRLIKVLERLQVRKKNIINFLPREHIVNRMLGRLLRRASNEITIDQLLYN